MKKLILTGIFLAAAAVTLHAQEPVADRMKAELKSEEFSVGFLLQSVGTFSFNDHDAGTGPYSFAYNGVPAVNKYDLGATRLSFQGTVDNNFLYKMQMDFRARPAILDAQVGYVFSDQFRIIAGAFKPSLSIDLDPNPGATDFINRARHVGAMMNSREIGVTALGDLEKLSYRIGMYNGTGLTRTGTNEFLYTARLAYTLYQTETSDIRFGLNGAVNQNDWITVGNTGFTSVDERKLYGFFTRYGSNRFFGTFEYLETRFNAPDYPDKISVVGFFGTVGTHITDKTDILARWDYLELDTGEAHVDDSSLLIFGVNHSPTKLIQLQLNLLYLVEKYKDNRFGLSANFQFQF